MKKYILCAVVLLSAACNKTQNVQSAMANIQGLENRDITGTVTFTQKDNGVLIVADIDGLTPGDHGFHVHEHGTCSGDGTSAGGHYNPTKQKHGCPDDPQRHVGDFGNLEADEDGHAHYERLDHVVQLNGPDSIVGRSMMIHADPDDCVSQPAGNSGTRIACGVIEAQ